MVMNQFLSSAQAARSLGVNDSRVRQLARQGRLPSQKVGSRWLIEARAVNRGRPRLPGRPLSPSSAWALLFLASGEEPQVANRRARRRLAKRLPSLSKEAERLSVRAEPRWFRADQRALAALRTDPDFIRSGVSVSEEYGVDIQAPNIVEGYFPQRKLDQFSYRYALRPVSEEAANLIVHSVGGRFPLAGRAQVPVAVAALDLLESHDERTRRAGAKLLRELTP